MQAAPLVLALALVLGTVPAGAQEDEGYQGDPGYGYDDSQIDLNGGKIYCPVHWKSKSDLSELRGQALSLRFLIKGAAFYSYRLIDGK